ncbi:MSHA biogenesis protein MshP [Vibrio alginolyticus]|uniref:MSHA biogenesis protein MshP n=1 Tax=Vibrio alginolyticus TaxID=663 RepID=UPI000CE99764|nr:MSHA biogenesis protein MshP [Vibrio alginolyticus]AVF66845.1 MSHA biogenesis protein MshP [Vibrio alginolyticus]ELA6640954.1 MSHA biogenesis protein MshP [Vibrio alginolyticus]ELK9269789.1 MSHA biogenesis protein MshP [Vibrio alginolyticus]ELN6885590.1 MSHA biogenesis protein MshP [Vibrio alginolyticus]ELN6907395.1 MSHA biogenesis protein MshP [Vibrio alginolyticus]
MSHRRNSSGNVLIIVLFVIIVMGYLASSLMKVTWSNQSGLTREFLGTKAWFVAQSANEWALTQLYPLNTDGSVITDVCSKIENGNTPPPTQITQGSGCRINTMTCSNIGTFNAGTSEAESLFRVQATAVCGSGVAQVQRQQEVWVKE